MDHALDEVLKHYGVKGMRWGVIKGRVGQNVDKAKSRVKEEWNSMSRERQWGKVLSDVSTMSTKSINQATRRLQLENDLKRLSKNNAISSSKDKQDYRRRENLTDEVLTRKVTRLRAKDGLHRAVREATKEQREFGKKVTNIAGPLAVQYAMGQGISGKSILKAALDPNQAKQEARKAVVDRYAGE